MTVDWPPQGWSAGGFEHGDHRHAYYVVGDDPVRSRPSVLLLHEFPGISQNLVELAETLASDFRVVIPSIVGRDGDPSSFDSLKQVCIRREVRFFAREGVSSSVGWLRDFADLHVADAADSRYGVIGMCMSGNFALALAVDPRVKAVVIAQPAIPVRPSGLGLSDADRTSLAARDDLRVHGYRFAKDLMSPRAKLCAGEKLLGTDRMQTFELREPRAREHSTLTGRWKSEPAIAAVTAFLNERLA